MIVNKVQIQALWAGAQNKKNGSGLSIKTKKQDMRICSVVIFSFSMLFLQQGFSQASATLFGTVRDARTNEPLIGASLFLQGTNLGAATDIDGRFEITNVPPKTYNIEASYI